MTDQQVQQPDQAAARRCPVCGAVNHCAVVAGGESCWCATVSIDETLKGWLRAQSLPEACVCQRCAAGAVPSPCINVCELDSSGERCIGCKRSLEEIGGWASYDAAQKAAVLARTRAVMQNAES